MPRQGLRRERVLTAAADLADVEGVEAATVTRVAAALGVRAPSLYNHVAGSDGLRRGIALLAVRELEAELRDAALGLGGGEGMAALARAYRAYARSHPGRYAAMQRAPGAGDEELAQAAARLVDVVGRVVAPAGAGEDELVHSVRAWRSAMHGFVDLELRGGFALQADREESYERLIAMLVAGSGA